MNFQSDSAHISARTVDVSGAPSKVSFNGKGITVETGAFSYAQCVNSKIEIMVCFESFSRAEMELGLFGKTVLKLQHCPSSSMRTCVSSELTQLCQ